MTTLDQAREAIYLRFETQWATRTAFTYQNESNKGLDAGTADWVRLSVLEVAGGQETLGPILGRRYRRNGSIIVQIFTRGDKGMSASAGHADTFRGIFEGVSFSGVDTSNAVAKEIGPDGKWHQTNVEVTFDYDEIK